MRGIEAVTFDVGRTLMFDSDLDLRRSRRAELKTWLRALGASVDRERLRELFACSELLMVELRARGEPRAADRVAECIARSLALRLTAGQRGELARLLEGLSDANRYQPVDGAAKALGRLRARGLALGIVSNRDSRPGWVTMRHLEHWGLAAFFEPAAVAWSDEVGCRKPGREIFLASLRGLGVAPERAVHVGDNPRADVVGPRRLGMMTVRYAGVRDNGGAGPEADAVIRHLGELAGALAFPGEVLRRAA